MTPGYVSGVSSLAGWGHDCLDGEGAVGTDYTGCRQRVMQPPATGDGRQKSTPPYIARRPLLRISPLW